MFSAVWAGAVSVALAGNAVSVKGSIRHIYEVEGGSVAVGRVVVVNPSDTPLDVLVRPIPPTPQGGAAARSNVDWISYTPSTVQLAPHGETSLEWRIVVPPDAAPGSHWSWLEVAPAPQSVVDEPTKERRLQLQSRLSYWVTLVVNVPGGLAAVEFDRPRLEGQGEQATLAIPVKNLGTLRIVPEVWLELTSESGEPLERRNAETSAIYPGESGSFAVPLNGIPLGRYSGILYADPGSGGNVSGTRFDIELR